MPSPAAGVFGSSLLRGRTFLALSRDARLRPQARQDARLFLHAALAVYVAAWEGYVERLISNFFHESIDPSDARFVSLHQLLAALASKAADRFHTPNWENSRSLLAEYTAYDPINDWIWPQKSMPGHQVRERLNEILRVRHSFAHGFSMPSFAWNTSASGEVRLTAQTVREIEAFFVNLVDRTDDGMKRHLLTLYNSSLTW
jgi:hypothetical protein